jgi:hypothetical protein
VTRKICRAAASAAFDRQARRNARGKLCLMRKISPIFPPPTLEFPSGV